MMARFQLTIAAAIVVFFFMFTLASARSPLLRPVNDVSLPENDAKPSQVVTNTDPSKSDLIKLLHPQSDSTNPIKISTDSENKSERSYVPLTVVRFRAVNRHFRPYTLRHRKRRCQHAMKPHTMIDPRSRYRGGVISFGHDMVFVGENRNLNPIAVSNQKRMYVPEKLSRFDGFLKGFRKFLNQFEF